MNARQRRRGRAGGLLLGGVVVGLGWALALRGGDLGFVGPCPCPCAPGAPALAQPFLPGQTAPPPTAPDGGDPPTPVVSLRVRVPATAAAGKEIEYRLHVENHSQAAAHHVIVRNPVPAHARFVRAEPEPSAREPELQWQLGSLPGGARREVVLVLAPTGTGDVQNCARVQFEHGQCVTTRLARPAVRLHKAGPAQALLYDALRYQITVTNTGPVEVGGLVLTDVLPAGLEHASGKANLIWDLGTLASGQQRTVDYQVIAKAAGRLCNKAVVAGAGGLREESESCVTVTEAKLSVEVMGPGQGYVNFPTAYQITVTNPGTAPVDNVQVTDFLPPGTAFVSASQGGRPAGNQVVWALGTVAPGARRTVDVVLRPQATGRICNRAAVTADRGLTAQGEFCTDFAGASALMLEVADTTDPVPVGGSTSYVITVRNQGMVPATNVRIVATVPEEMSVARALPAEHKQEGQVVRYDPVTIPPGGEARYTLEVKAQRAGDVRFQVELTADQLPAGPVHRQESTTVYSNLPSARARDVAP